MSLRKAAQRVGVNVGAARKWMELGLADVIKNRLERWEQRNQRGLQYPPLPSQVPKPAPAAGLPAQLDDQEELRSWQLLNAIIEEPDEAIAAIRLAAAGKLSSSIPRVVHVHRYSLAGLQPAKIADLIGRTRRRVQQLRKVDPVPELVKAYRKHLSEPARAEANQRRRDANIAQRRFRGLLDEEDLPPEPFRQLGNYSKKYGLPVLRPERDTVPLDPFLD